MYAGDLTLVWNSKAMPDKTRTDLLSNTGVLGRFIRVYM